MKSVDRPDCGQSDESEDVATMVSRYDLLAIPVVDDRSLLGIITVDICGCHQRNARQRCPLGGWLEQPIKTGLFSMLSNSVSWLLVTLFGWDRDGELINAFGQPSKPKQFWPDLSQ